MVNTELIQWIINKRNQGYSKEQIYNSMIQNNYTVSIANKALDQVYNSEKISKSSKKPLIWIFIIAGILLICGFVFFNVLNHTNSEFEKIETLALNSNNEIIPDTGSNTTNANSKINNDKDILITWNNFTKETNYKDEAFWQLGIKINNNQNKQLLVYIEGVGLTRNWESIIETQISSDSFKTLNIKIKHYIFKEPAFDKKNITIFIFDCNKAEEDVLCSVENPTDLSLGNIVRDKEFNGTPIEPTIIETKYFNFNSFDTAPNEISAEEYNIELN